MFDLCLYNMENQSSLNTAFFKYYCYLLFIITQKKVKMLLSRVCFS